jgi:hypothetical protein
MENLAGSYCDLLLTVLSDPELQLSLEDVADLLVLMEMPGDQATLGQVDVGQHDTLTGD